MDLGVLGTGHESFANAVSSDGSVVVGRASDATADDVSRAFRWTQATGIVSLGRLNGGKGSAAFGVSGDGSVVVGTAWDGIANDSRAFRWTQAGGMTSLGCLNDGGNALAGCYSAANGVSGDGSVVVGFSSDGRRTDRVLGLRAFRWTQAAGMVSLGALNGQTDSVARGVSSDGSVVVGESWTTTLVPGVGSVYSPYRAFRWTQSSGMANLGVLNGGSMSLANAVSANGNVVVGQADDGAAGGARRAFRWTQGSGMQTVETWLRSNGVSVPAAITNNANGVNADGSVVVGETTNHSAFIARVTPASDGGQPDRQGGSGSGGQPDRQGSFGSGLVTLQDLSTSLSGNSSAPSQAAAVGSLALNGNHSRPLAHRVGPGESCFWTGGDVGRNDHEDRGGRFGLGEITGCHRFESGIQGSLSVGASSSRENLPFNGDSKARGTYGVAEILGRVYGNLWATGSLFYLSGDINANRGYLNAGTQDFSRGRPGMQSTALRLRLDWENAAELARTQLTPYVDVSHANNHIEGYTETGGGFPVRFDPRAEKVTELRVGTDALHPISSKVTFVGRVEAAHRFEKTGASTSGTVLGLFDFNLPGQQIRRDWLRLGAGLEAKLGIGTVSAMANVTTQGAVPSVWLNVAYQVAF
jgi:probable HAF family extracellular repeat protein